ncbi:MAG: hypothetical protein QM844_14025 [Planctomycetota bacterium]|nr:hypothetical protein [Planctomycetota bacterium]
MFYRLDSTRVTLREYWWGTRSPLVVFGWLAKWLRIGLPGSVDDPNVDSLAPFRVAPGDLPAEARSKFHALHEAIEAIGFRAPVCYWVHDIQHQTEICQAAYVHPSGQTFAKLHGRIWRLPRPPRQYFFPMFLTRFTDGSYLVSTAGRRDILAPPGCRENRLVGAAPETLWAAHQRAVQEEQLFKTVAPVRGEADLVAAVEAHHAMLRDFHVERGVFAPIPPEEERQVAEAAAAALSAGPDGEDRAQDLTILNEIEKLRNKRSSWGAALTVLVVSVLFFIALGKAVWSWQFVLLLLPILFIHELGHFAAMRLFRYQNVRMFFIPLFGAAVAGHHYNVPGWKKVIVSLSGPLPGIFLAAALGVLAMAYDIPWLLAGAMLTVLVNGFNLLPLIPLDGGWVMHALLFCRHYVLDAGFRLLAVCTLLAGAYLLADPILAVFGFLMAMALPVAFRMARVVETLRRRGVAATSPDDQSISPEAVSAIAGEIRSQFPQRLSDKNLAQFTLQAFEALNARPPGVLATIVLGGAYAGSIVLAAVLLALLVIGQQVDLADFFRAAADAPRQPIAAESIERAGLREAPAAPGEKTIIARFAAHEEAKAAFDESRNQVPAGATLVLFGNLLMLAIPAEDAPGEAWAEGWNAEADGVSVAAAPYENRFAFAAIAPDADAAIEIERALQAYLPGPPSMNLVPPWHPDLPLGPAQRDARGLYRQLLEAEAVHDDPRQLRLRRQIAEAHRKGDGEQVESLAKQLRETSRRIRAERIDALQKQAVAPAERELIELFRQKPAFASIEDDGGEGPDGAGGQAAAPAAREAAAQAFQEKHEAWSRKFGERLGQLPMEGDGVVRGADRYSSIGGSVARTGLIVQIDVLSFARPVDGPAALVRWLSGKKSADLKYELSGEF